MYKTGHAFTYLLRGRRPAARASDLRVVRTGPVCCEPRHRRMEKYRSRPLCRLSAYVHTEGGHFERYL